MTKYRAECQTEKCKWCSAWYEDEEFAKEEKRKHVRKFSHIVKVKALITGNK